MKKPNKTIISLRIESLLFLFVIAISVALIAASYYLQALFLGVIILILILLGDKPHIGYYLIIFLIPFGSYRGLEAYPFIKIHWLVGLWIVIVLSLKFLIQKEISTNLQSNLWPWFLIFFVICFISTFLSQYGHTSFNTLFLLLVAYMFFALNLVFISPKDFSKTLPLILVLSISISSLLCIIGYLFDLSFFTVDVGQGSLKRGVGVSTSPNNFCTMIIFNLPLICHWIFTSRRFVEKIFAASLFIINLIAIILTYSRGGAIVLSILLFLLFIEHMKKFRPKYLGFFTSLVAITFITALIFIPSSYWERQKSITAKRSDRAIDRRISYLHVGWDAFKQNPFLGSGPGTFRDIFSISNYARLFEREGGTNRRFAHNTYLEVLVGTGFMGLLIFFLILWRALRNFHLARRYFQLFNNEEMVSMIRAYQLSFISLLIYLLMFSNTYHKYLLLSFALSQVALRLSRNTPEGERLE